MKRIMITVLLAVVLTGCVESSDTFYGVDNVNRLVDNVRINEYFIHNNKYWKVCRDYKSKAWDKEEGFQVEKYPKYPITNVFSGKKYKHKIYEVDDGKYEMEVKMECTFRVYVQLNVFAHHDENFKFDGGTIYFHMDVEEQEGKYRLNGMKAYKHIID